VAGRKVFTSGEILTAADVNSFLMDQSVMVFADSSARSSAIPTPSEGMVTFREDQDVVEVYDGSAFKTVGGLVAVESALKTDTFTASVGAGGNVAVTDLSITHEVSDPANKLIISAFFGAGNQALGRLGIAIHDGSGLISVGNTAGSRTSVAAGGTTASDSGGNLVNRIVTMPAITFVHSPGSGSKTYTVRAVNINNATSTLYVNRADDDADNATRSRAVSSLVIQEVAV
jgi:hypothetical protein